MKIAYVILHYMACKDTIECAKSILVATRSSIHQTMIIIVDNGSLNNSYNEIRREFEGNDKVKILHSKENLGFARGNNLGFCYAKKQYQTDFIVQLNNDTIVSQTDFNEILVRKYEEIHYAVLGPDIVTLDGCHQNPGRIVDWTKRKLITFRIKKMIQYFLAHFAIFDKVLTLNDGSYPKVKIEKEILNTPLHGACYIFSPDYISKFDGMYDKTFLYMEEDILKLRADYFGYLMMYSPELEIIHKEDIATNMVAVKSIEKKKRVYKNLLDSSKIYSDLKRQYEKEM